jgi:hypothetical protein
VTHVINIKQADRTAAKPVLFYRAGRVLYRHIKTRKQGKPRPCRFMPWVK